MCDYSQFTDGTAEAWHLTASGGHCTGTGVLSEAGRVRKAAFKEGEQMAGAVQGLSGGRRGRGKLRP